MDTKKNIDEIILENFDFEGLGEDEKSKVLEETKNLLLENTLITLMEETDDEKSEAFEKFLEEERSAEELVAYLEEHLPRFNEVLFEEVKSLTSA